MSRAAVSKSRADKGSKPPPAHTPVVAHEIVPGKFTDQDWYGLSIYMYLFVIFLNQTNVFHYIKLKRPLFLVYCAQIDSLAHYNCICNTCSCIRGVHMHIMI